MESQKLKFQKMEEDGGACICDYRRGLDWWIGRFIDHLQAVTTNNYKTIAISTIYISLEHTVLMFSVCY
jgi:hypothetical protein